VEKDKQRLKILVYDQDEEGRKVLSETLNEHDVEFHSPEERDLITDQDLMKFDLLILDGDDPSAKNVLRRACTYYPDNLGRLATFLFLFGFWIIMSGKFDLFHLSLGFLCSLLIGSISHDLLFEDVKAKNRHVSIARFLGYLPWLIYQVILANLHVVYLVLSPKMPIDPKIIKFNTKLTSDISKVTLANSITLTPGTITMDIIDGEFYVHAVSKKVADDLLTGEMEQRVAYIYLEGEKFKK
jgi:multicomponent Na+:H+ antiporter subunit E